MTLCKSLSNSIPINRCEPTVLGIIKPLLIKINKKIALGRELLGLFAFGVFSAYFRCHGNHLLPLIPGVRAPHVNLPLRPYPNSHREHSMVKALEYLLRYGREIRVDRSRAHESDTRLEDGPYPFPHLLRIE